LEEEAMDKEQQIDAVLPHLEEWANRVLGGFPASADKAYAAARPPTSRHGNYCADLILDHGEPLTDEQIDWLWAQPLPLARQLNDLADECDNAVALGLAERGNAMRRIRDRLRQIAGEVDK